MAEATRVAFGRALVRVGADPRVVVIDGDLASSTHTRAFGDRYPERFFELGIAEGNMVGVAAGLALAGKIPFAASFACFLAGRFEQIRVSIAYNRANVKLVGTHAGIGIGEDGYSQMGLEDVGLMRTLPDVVVVQPADAAETEQAVEHLATHEGPAYLRLTRQKVADVSPPGYRFEFGKAVVLREGTDLTIAASGAVVGNALAAAGALAKEGVDVAVLNVHTLKPIDGAALAAWGGRTGGILTVEDHSVTGGLGSAVCEALAESGIPVRRHGVHTFGESGSAEALYAKHGLDAAGIATQARAFLADLRGHERRAVRRPA
ncbi:MAG TPA: transketolase C-terminal domain-containing protein [Candidatus Binatia bacterium]|jgi:transketolase|nr:transketolase C-terminal domain-containing protein [Candidatus Binatia bacterium]